MDDKQKIIPLQIQQASEEELAFIRVLDSRIIGQKSGKAAAARALRRAMNKLRNKRGPIYKILQIGKSRTGKTLTAETAALSLHGDSTALIFVDCENYKQPHQIQQLLGAPPSYVGYRDPKHDLKPGELDPSALFSRANLVSSRRKSGTPYTIVLLDEIEKASDEFLDVLLGIFDKGKITLSNNLETDFTDVIFFMTSNLGMREVEKLSNPIGLRQPQKKEGITEKDIAQVVGGELKDRFKPEFLKRIDEVVIFAPLTPEQLAAVVDLEIGLLKERIEQSLSAKDKFKVELEPSVKDFILAQSLKDDGGVAEIKHVVERYIADVLGNELSKNTILGGDTVTVSHQSGGELTFVVSRPEKPPVITGGTGTPTAGDKPAPPGLAISNQEGLDQLIKLAQREMQACKDQKGLSMNIKIGPSLRKLALSMGKEVGADWDSLQGAFFSQVALRVLNQKCANPYWYWRLVYESAMATPLLPIRQESVLKAISKIHQEEGTLVRWDLNNRSTLAYLCVRGLMLVGNDSKGDGFELVRNPLFDVR